MSIAHHTYVWFAWVPIGSKWDIEPYLLPMVFVFEVDIMHSLNAREVMQKQEYNTGL